MVYAVKAKECFCIELNTLLMAYNFVVTPFRKAQDYPLNLHYVMLTSILLKYCETKN
jgi:hypothetical protein